MRRPAVVGMILVFLIPTSAWALGADHPQGPVNHETWSEGLTGLINAENRVHGYFVNWEDVFFFKGDTAALNDFLTRYAQLPDTKLQVVIHPGKLDARSPWDKRSRGIAADWELYASPFSQEQLQPGGLKPGPFVTRVDVWLGGSIRLDELRIPEKIPVESGGEIEAFIKKHGPAPHPPLLVR